MTNPKPAEPRPTYYGPCPKCGTLLGFGHLPEKCEEAPAAQPDLDNPENWKGIDNLDATNKGGISGQSPTADTNVQPHLEPAEGITPDRAEFEKWWRTHKTFSDDYYGECMWDAWQAAGASLRAELAREQIPETIHLLRSMAMFAPQYWEEVKRRIAKLEGK